METRMYNLSAAKTERLNNAKNLPYISATISDQLESAGLFPNDNLITDGVKSGPIKRQHVSIAWTSPMAIVKSCVKVWSRDLSMSSRRRRAVHSLYS